MIGPRQTAAHARPRRASAFATAVSSILSRYVGMVLTFATFSFVSHRYGVAALGVFASAFGTASTLCYAVGLGAHESPRASAGQNQAFVVRQALLFGAVTAFGGLGFAALALVFARPDNLSYLLWSALWCAGWGLNVCGALSLIATGAERRGAFFFYTAGATGTFLVILSVTAFGDGGAVQVVAAASLTYLTIALASVGSGLWLTRGSEIRWRLVPSAIRGIVNTGAPFAWARVVQATALWLPVWIAGVVLGAAEAGVAGATMRLAVAAMAAMAAVRLVFRRLMPRLLEAGHRTRLALLASAVGTFAAVATTAGIVVILLQGNWILSLIFGPGLDGKKFLLIAALIGTLIEGLFGLSEDILRFCGHSRRLSIVQTVAVAVFAIVATLAASAYGLVALMWVYPVYVAIVQSTYVIWLRRKEKVVIGPIFSYRKIRFASRIKH